MRRKHPEIIDVASQELKDVVQRAKQSLDRHDAELIEKVVESYEYVSELIQQKNMSIKRLHAMLFGAKTEKTATVVRGAADDSSAGEATSQDQQPANGSEVKDSEGTDSEGTESDPTDAGGKPPPKGHGRNGADAYAGAEQIVVEHESLSPGDRCPECEQGTVYEKAPSVVVRITGQAPLGAKRYQLQRLRCHLCGKVFTATLPESATTTKYDASAVAMIGLLKYGSGLPFNRLEGLQRNLEIPLPTSTQWDVIASFTPKWTPVFEELIRQAAQGEVLHNDDTTVKILNLMGTRRGDGDDESSRTGLFTSGVVAVRRGRRIALFFSGRQHAGENLADVLKRRAAELDAPIQMCDALSRNLPGALATILGNCLSHARRRFVDVHDLFPEPCRTVLETLRLVYHNDAVARDKEMTAEERLRFHQEHSQPAMTNLDAWLNRQFDAKLVEPNSALGGAIQYLLKHWQKLTLFLRQSGAPLDNNICERALKKAILHRKNALFFKTQKGARVGDLYMSLIHTCELNRVNPFDYLVQLLHHSEAVAAQPERCMPWNYRESLHAVTAN